MTSLTSMQVGGERGHGGQSRGPSATGGSLGIWARNSGVGAPGTQHPVGDVTDPMCSAQGAWERGHAVTGGKSPRWGRGGGSFRRRCRAAGRYHARGWRRGSARSGTTCVCGDVCAYCLKDSCLPAGVCRSWRHRSSKGRGQAGARARGGVRS
jgi:hypothetical protein